MISYDLIGNLPGGKIEFLLENKLLEGKLLNKDEKELLLTLRGKPANVNTAPLIANWIRNKVRATTYVSSATCPFLDADNCHSSQDYTCNNAQKFIAGAPSCPACCYSSARFI